MSIFASSHWLKVNSYQVSDDSSEANGSLRVIVLADLHDHEFSADNSRLVSQVAAQEPDIILLAGDMLNSYSENSDIACNLVSQLTDIAPVYYGMGNHELDYMVEHPELRSELEAAGAVVLDKGFVDVEVAGAPVRIGGLYDYAFYLEGVDEKELSDERVEVKHFLEEFEDTDAYKIMISHRPDSFIFADAAEAWDIDLVVSGHLHGGQVVVPLLGGVYGGDQGWFPEYVHGMYEKGKIHLFVTSGLGTNEKAVTRVNNRPEIAVIEVGD